MSSSRIVVKILNTLTRAGHDENIDFNSTPTLFSLAFVFVLSCFLLIQDLHIFVNILKKARVVCLLFSKNISIKVFLIKLNFESASRRNQNCMSLLFIVETHSVFLSLQLFFHFEFGFRICEMVKKWNIPSFRIFFIK